MIHARLLVLTTLAMLAFAANSLLCRLALHGEAMDAASFTSIRLISAALVLWLIVSVRRKQPSGQGNWPSALALFAYAAGFSFAYIHLTTATGALLLFGAVQVTMIGYGLWSGERLRWTQWSGVCLALAGLIGLMLPGLSAPPLAESLLMLGAGVAWGVYSLRGKGAGDPTRITTGNFLRTVPLALAIGVLFTDFTALDVSGFWYAVASGALASGVGYAIWYSVLPVLQATHAATIQLSVPVIAAVGGVLLLEEPITLRLWLASVAILGGIALVILTKSRRTTASPAQID